MSRITKIPLILAFFLNLNTLVFASEIKAVEVHSLEDRSPISGPIILPQDLAKKVGFEKIGYPNGIYITSFDHGKLIYTVSNFSKNGLCLKYNRKGYIGAFRKKPTSDETHGDSNFLSRMADGLKEFGSALFCPQEEDCNLLLNIHSMVFEEAFLEFIKASTIADFFSLPKDIWLQIAEKSITNSVQSLKAIDNFAEMILKDSNFVLEAGVHKGETMILVSYSAGYREDFSKKVLLIKFPQNKIQALINQAPQAILESHDNDK